MLMLRMLLLLLLALSILLAMMVSLLQAEVTGRGHCLTSVVTSASHLARGSLCSKSKKGSSPRNRRSTSQPTRSAGSSRASASSSPAASRRRVWQPLRAVCGGGDDGRRE
jgi:hypothetical protein